MRRDRQLAQKLKPSYERRYRQTIRKVDLWSVLKISICFYVMALAVILFAGIVLWWIVRHSVSSGTSRTSSAIS